MKRFENIDVTDDMSFATMVQLLRYLDFGRIEMSYLYHELLVACVYGTDQHHDYYYELEPVLTGLYDTTPNKELMVRCAQRMLDSSRIQPDAHKVIMEASRNVNVPMMVLSAVDDFDSETFAVMMFSKKSESGDFCEYSFTDSAGLRAAAEIVESDNATALRQLALQIDGDSSFWEDFMCEAVKRAGESEGYLDVSEYSLYEAIRLVGDLFPTGCDDDFCHLLDSIA